VINCHANQNCFMNDRQPQDDLDLATVQLISDLYRLGSGATVAEKKLGTAGRNAVITTTKGRFLLRIRSREHCNLNHVNYEHELLAALRETDFPVVPPLTNTAGATFTDLPGGRICELYPWVNGKLFEYGNARQLKELAGQLARFHKITKELNLTTSKQQIREDHPDRLAEEIVLFLEAVDAATKPDLIRKVQDALGDLKRRFPDDLHDSLPQAIIHGDLHPGNVKFAGDRLVGLFDFDWANHQARIRDIGDGLMFFARKDPGRRFQDGDIRSMTCSFDFDPPLVRNFLDAYENVSRLDQTERQCLVPVMSLRWLQIRIRGMRKTPTEDRLDFLDRHDLFRVLERINALTF